MKQITILEQLNGDYFTLYDNAQGSTLNDFEGFEYATVVPSIDELAGDYGAVYINSKHSTRRLSIKGDLISSDVFTLRRTLLKALRQTGTIKLLSFITYDNLLLQTEAEVVKMTNPYNHSVHSFLIEFLAPDWRFYSQELHSVNLPKTIVSGGASIPFPTIPLSIPISVDATTLHIITTAGNEATDPVFTITGPGENFIIENVTAGKQFILDYTLTSGQEVVIDVKNRTVVLDGTTNLYPFITGEFWSLLPGDNDLRFFISNGADVETNLNVVYRDAYNGI
jgi:hypothetical protein